MHVATVYLVELFLLFKYLYKDHRSKSKAIFVNAPMQTEVDLNDSERVWTLSQSKPVGSYS